MNAKHLGLLLLALGLAACSNQSPTLHIRPPEAPKWAPAKLQKQETIVAQPAAEEEYTPEPEGEIGLASWYGRPYHGRKTASGEIFDRNALTAAHASLPLGTNVEVTNLATGRSVTLRINDRFPGRPGYVIDVSQAAAARLGFEREGRARVSLKPVEDG